MLDLTFLMIGKSKLNLYLVPFVMNFHLTWTVRHQWSVHLATSCIARHALKISKLASMCSSILMGNSRSNALIAARIAYLEQLIKS